MLVERFHGDFLHFVIQDSILVCRVLCHFELFLHVNIILNPKPQNLIKVLIF